MARSIWKNLHEKRDLENFCLEEKRSVSRLSLDTRSLDTCSSIVSCVDEFNVASGKIRSNESIYSMYMEVGSDGDLDDKKNIVDIDNEEKDKKCNSLINNNALLHESPVLKTKDLLIGEKDHRGEDHAKFNINSSEQMFFKTRSEQMSHENKEIKNVKKEALEKENVLNEKKKNTRMRKEELHKRSRHDVEILQTQEHNTGTNQHSLSEDEALSRFNLVPLRADQINKVSPFDDVPGFQRSFSARQRSSLRNDEMLSGKSRLLKPCTSEPFSSKPIASSREKWIQFEEGHNIVNQTSPCVSPSKFPTLEPCQSPNRANWVSFTEAMNSNPDVLVSDSTANDLPTDKDSEKLIESTAGDKLTKKTSSVEDLLSVVNKTVGLLKHSITTDRSDDEEIFCDHNNEDDSDLSDEIISLDYESDEDNKVLRDVPAKQFADVTLFRASSALRSDSRQKEFNNSTRKPSVQISDIVTDNKMDEYPLISTRNSWSFWYRYPDRKHRISSRKWLPVKVKLEGDFIQLRGEQKNGLDILKEVPLHPFFVFTIPVIHRGNKDGRVHSVKLQYVKYRETHRLKTRVTLEHIPIYTPVFKLASRDIISLREFIDNVENIVRRIPTYRNKGITYRHEEIFIDSDDECQFLLSGDGEILKYNITVQLRLRVFVTGNPDFKLFLNDSQCKEVLSRTKETLLRETKSSATWITPKKVEFHPCVDCMKSEDEGGVVFIPPDGCSFELMRFRVQKNNTIPILAKSSLELLSGNSVRLQASIQVSGDAKSIRHKRNDVIVYFPIPPSWSTLFVRSRTLNGTKKYIKTKDTSKTTSPATATLNRVTLQVSCGKAKYEPAMGSIVWRLGNLPIMQDGVPADAVHKFQCFLELPFPLEIRDDFQPYSYVEFSVPHQLASGVSVEEVLLSDGRVPDKWVCYRANYVYKVSMKLIENGKMRGATAS